MKRAKKTITTLPEPPHVTKQREFLMSLVELTCELDDGPSQDALLADIKFDAPGWTNDDIRDVFSVLIAKLPPAILYTVGETAIAVARGIDEMAERAEADEKAGAA